MKKSYQVKSITGALNRSKTLFLFLIVGIFSFTLMAFCLIDKQLLLYVSPSGNDTGNGSVSSPFRTLQKAQSAVKIALNKGGYSAIIVYLHGGEYLLSKPLVFTPEDGAPAGTYVEYKAYKNEKPVLSGGVILPSTWAKVPGHANCWTLRIPPLTGIDKKSINQLFANGVRLKRASSPEFFANGPLDQFKADFEKFKNYDRFTFNTELKERTLLPFCTFSYQNHDLDNLNDNDIANAEILMYHSWDATLHSIAKIDKSNSAVYLKNSSQYPVGFFITKNKYTVENCKRYLHTPESWCYDNIANEIFYIAKPNQNPNTLKFVLPAITKLMILKGNNTSLSVANIKFTNISFKYTIAPRGLNRDAYRGKLSAGSHIPWLDFTTGFAAMQGDIDCGESILLQNAKNISFANCDYSNLGSYAIRIDKYSDNNEISNCTLHELGGGGVVIGYDDSNPSADGIPLAASPSGNSITNCVISNLGLVFKSSLGIGILNANHTTISNNKIFNAPYSGISCGWSWGDKISYTSDNLIINNEIYNVLQALTDGGGIYTLGKQRNTIIKGNRIHDIKRAAGAIGAFSNGIFMDEGSAQMKVEQNTIYNIQNQKIRLNATDSTKINWGVNILRP